MAPTCVPPYLRSQRTGRVRLPPALPRGRPLQPPAKPRTPSNTAGDSTTSTPTWRQAAAVPTGLIIKSAAYGPMASDRRPTAPSYQADGISRRGITAKEAYRYCTYERASQLLQPKPIAAEQCDEEKEYAQWAGGYVEINDKLLSVICPCNLVGKPCAFDELPDGCSMVRLCGQLEKWTLHKCPDKGFRTILETAGNVPVDYGKKGFGAVNYYDSSDNESGGVALGTDLDVSSLPTSDNDQKLQPTYNGKRASFNDFSCGIRNDCGRIHCEVEINCRFVGSSHCKDTHCKQVLEKYRLCSGGHDLESNRQAARDAVKDPERTAARCGAPQPKELGKVWVY